MLQLELSGVSDTLPMMSLELFDYQQNKWCSFSFLVDTGADQSSLAMKYYDGPVSAASIDSVGIDGAPIKCPKTHPLDVRSPIDPALRLQHKFVVIPACPFNLIGRDLLFKLGCTLTFGKKGLTLHTETLNHVMLTNAPKSTRAQARPEISLSEADLTMLKTLSHSINPSLTAPLTQAPQCVFSPEKDREPGSNVSIDQLLVFPDMLLLTDSSKAVYMLATTSDKVTRTHSKPVVSPIRPCIQTTLSMRDKEGQLVPDYLTEIPSTFWATHSSDTGFIDCTPYKAVLKEGARPVFCKQYPLSKEKEEGIKPLIDSLLEQGVIVPTTSAWNTPINPIKKSTGEFRFTHDLRAVNDLIVPLGSHVADIPSILTVIPADHTHFTTCDLSNAYFSIPVDRETQPLLAFSYKSRQYTYRRLPQGYIDSSSAFSAVVRETLVSFFPPPGCTLVTYADDLLLSAETKELCEVASVMLLKHLAAAGFKAALHKMQWALPEVKYLGFILSKGKRTLSSDRIQLIQAVPPPETKKAMASFLGLTNFCRAWIPDCSFHDKALRAACAETEPERIVWTKEMMFSFSALKRALCSSPGLGLPNYEIPFHLYVKEGAGTTAAVLAQEHGNGYRPVAYLSKTFDPIVQGMPGCLRAVAGCAMMVTDAQKIVQGHPLVLHASHHVLTILHNISSQHMTAQRRCHYDQVLTNTVGLTVKPLNDSNPATLLYALLDNQLNHTVAVTPPHNCLEEINASTAARIDLSTVPFEEGHHVYVDGSCSKPSDGVYLCGYAVCHLPDTVLEAYSLPFISAQAAELVALTRACRLHENKTLSVYTDSIYAFNVVHCFARLWAMRGFVSADRKQISHKTLIADLLQAVNLPEKLAVVKVKGHSQKGDIDAEGNDFADAVASWASREGKPSPHYTATPTYSMFTATYTPQYTDILILQTSATDADLEHWASKACVKADNGLIYDREKRLCLPLSCLPFLVRHFHGVGHVGQAGVIANIGSRFCIRKLHSTVKLIVGSCLICVRAHKGRVPIQHDALPTPKGPFQSLQIDFTHMPQKGPFKYMLVIVCEFSKWPEAFPCANENAKTVVRILSKEIFPRFGIAMSLNSDGGPAFTARVTRLLCKYLQIDWHYHIPYHPESSGYVERMNRTIKSRVTKAALDTGKSWVDILPAVLAEIRMTPSATTKLSPFEVIMGRPFPTPWTRGMGAPSISGDLDVAMCDYTDALVNTLNGIYGDVSLSLPLPSDKPTHPFEPGDRVLVLSLKTKGVGDPPYGPPTTVIAVTRTAVLTDSAPQWIHATRLKRAPRDQSIS